MKFKPFEIDVLVDYYTNELAICENRMNNIHHYDDEYDSDLRDEQIKRLRTQQKNIEERIKELQNFEAEMN